MSTDKLFFINVEKEFVKRFDLGKYINFENDAYDILNSFFILKLKSLPVFGEYLVQSDEKKPDLISFRIYDDTQYWWVLLLYNDIFDPQLLTTGIILNYPSLSKLESFVSTLKARERESR